MSTKHVAFLVSWLNPLAFLKQHWRRAVGPPQTFISTFSSIGCVSLSPQYCALTADLIAYKLAKHFPASPPRVEHVSLDAAAHYIALGVWRTRLWLTARSFYKAISQWWGLVLQLGIPCLDPLHVVLAELLDVDQDQIYALRALATNAGWFPERFAAQGMYVGPEGSFVHSVIRT